MKAISILALFSFTLTTNTAHADRSHVRRNLKRGSRKGDGNDNNEPTTPTTIVVASVPTGLTQERQIGPGSEQAGDRNMFDDPLYMYDPDTGTLGDEEIGRSRGVCTVLKDVDNSNDDPTPAVFHCQGSYTFEDGKIMIQGDYVPLTDMNAIVGGTGAYKSASGEVEITIVAPYPNPPPILPFINVFTIHLD